MPLFAAKGMMSSGGGGNFYTLVEAKRDTYDNSSYRQPSGMYDVATSSSGEVYTVNGERNTLTGLYNTVVAKIGAIGAVSWQYTFSSAKNVYPCALACNTTDNSIFVCFMVTTNENGANNYNLKRFNYSNAGWNDSTNDAIYHIMKISSAGTRVWENIWNSSNSATYPASINNLNSSSNFEHANVFENRNDTSSEMCTSKMGAPDLKITKVRSYRGTGFESSEPRHPEKDTMHDSFSNFVNPGSDSLVNLGYAFGGEESYEAFSLDGPAFGGRPQSTSNIAIDITNERLYILVAGNATTTDLSKSRSTLQALQIPFNGVAVQAKELVYPGGWDQNAKITLDKDGNLLIPWTGTNKEELYKNQTASNYLGLFDTGTSSDNINTGNTGAFMRVDWANDEFDFTWYAKDGNAPIKVCKVEPEPVAEGTVYEYVSTGGLTPAPNVVLGRYTTTRENQGQEARVQIGRHSNLVQLNKKNIATNAIDWVRTFFAIPNASIRDMNNYFNNGSVNDRGTAFVADIHFADSKVFANGIYYVGNVVLSNWGPSGSSYTNKLSYLGFVAKIKFDGTVDYIREVRGLKDVLASPSEKPKYEYEPLDDGGVLLDSINFDAFNNMILTARTFSNRMVGTVGNYIDNVILKLPHNGDLIGPILVDDAELNVTRRFSYTPASTVRCWEETKYDTTITNSTNLETYKLLRCCALWNTHANNATDPTSLGNVTTQANYNAWMGSGDRLVTLDNGTYAGRFLWQGPTTNLQIDSTTNRQWDRADRRSSSNIFLQTYEETTSTSTIEVQKSCGAYVYVDQAVNTDNAKTDFDVPSYSKSNAAGVLGDIQEISKQENFNAMVSVSQYWDGDTGLRKQLLTRHTPTGGVESRIYDTGFNTYPKDVCVDEVGNIYTVGWTADTTNSNNFGCGYITCYNKDMTFQWDYQYVNSDSTTLDTATENFQIHACAVTLDTSNTAVLFIGGHYSRTSGATNTQFGAIASIPLSITGSGGATVVGMGNSSGTILLGGAQSGNAVDGVFGLDVTQVNSTDGNRLYVGYAGKTYDSTGTTTRGMYGVTKWNGITPVTTASENWAYIVGDDLRLSTFAFSKGVDDYEKQLDDFGLKFAVGGDETQAGDTNAVVIVGNIRRRSGGSKSHNDGPHSSTSFVINNGNGADIIKDLRFGFMETPGIQQLNDNSGTRDEKRDSESTIQTDAVDTFYTRGSYQDRLFAALSVTNQFSQLDSYVLELTTASLPERTNGYRRTPDAANITRAGKISTSGITQPGGIAVLGPQYGTLMVASTCANSGTPNDRQILTAKLPLDMSNKNSAYTEVGSQFVYWDATDFSLTITGKSLFAIELDQLATASYYDGTRFYWGSTSANGSWSTYAGNTVANVDNEGTFTVRTKDLQQYKQS